MKRVILAISLLTASLFTQAGEPAAARPTLDAFAWLAGHWRIEDGDKKVIYARQSDGSLLAAIEGPGRDGKPRRVEYPFKRVP